MGYGTKGLKNCFLFCTFDGQYQTDNAKPLYGSVPASSVKIKPALIISGYSFFNAHCITAFEPALPFALIMLIVKMSFAKRFYFCY